MEANIIVNLIPAMATYQKTGKQSTSPQTKYRNRERLFTQRICQSFSLILKQDQPLAFTDTLPLPYLELPTLMPRHQGMFFPIPPPSEVSNSEKPSRTALWRWLHTAKVISSSKIQGLQK